MERDACSMLLAAVLALMLGGAHAQYRSARNTSAPVPLLKCGFATETTLNVLFQSQYASPWAQSYGWAVWKGVAGNWTCRARGIQYLPFTPVRSTPGDATAFGTYANVTDTQWQNDSCITAPLACGTEYIFALRFFESYHNGPMVVKNDSLAQGHPQSLFPILGYGNRLTDVYTNWSTTINCSTRPCGIASPPPLGPSPVMLPYIREPSVKILFSAQGALTVRIMWGQFVYVISQQPALAVFMWKSGSPPNTPTCQFNRYTETPWDGAPVEFTVGRNSSFSSAWTGRSWAGLVPSCATKDLQCGTEYKMLMSTTYSQYGTQSFVTLLIGETQPCPVDGFPVLPCPDSGCVDELPVLS